MHPLFRCRLSGLVALCRLRLARRLFRLGLFWRWLYLSVGLHGFVGSCSICRLLGSSIGEQINLLRLARLYLCSLLLDSLCRRFRLIDNGFLRDVYVVLGDAQADRAWTMRVYVKPLANWIWGGSLLMALGGALSLSDRRFRVAAGARKTTPAPKGVPAE